jgi:hypothetical protein
VSARASSRPTLHVVASSRKWPIGCLQSSNGRLAGPSSPSGRARVPWPTYSTTAVSLKKNQRSPSTSNGRVWRVPLSKDQTALSQAGGPDTVPGSSERGSRPPRGLPAPGGGRSPGPRCLWARSEKRPHCGDHWPAGDHSGQDEQDLGGGGCRLVVSYGRLAHEMCLVGHSYLFGLWEGRPSSPGGKESRA